MNLSRQKQFAQQYATNAVETLVTEATPHKLVEMLYEGAIRNLTISKMFIDKNNLEKKSEHINKALGIINGLKSGVDVDQGEIADNFLSIYDYCYRRVLQASIQNNTELLDEVISILSGLNTAWKEMPDSIKKMPANKIDQLKN